MTVFSSERFPMLHKYLVLGVPILLYIAVCSVGSAPLSQTHLNICQGDDTPSNQAQAWPSNIILYTMSSNLTDELRTEILKGMAVWEKRLCYNIAFIPSQTQEGELEHFVRFVPGERCCLDRGKTGVQEQTVYVHDSCVADATLEDVLGMLFGNTQQRSSVDSRQTNSTGDADSRAGNLTEHGNSTNMSLSSSTLSGATLIPTECQDTCIKHIIGRVNGRSKRGRIFSPNYPMDYPINSDCVWKVTVPENAALRLTFDDFNTECSYDYLEIHHLITEEGSIDSLDRLCGDLTEHEPITSHLTRDTVILRFHTDDTYNSKGFNISYEFVENKHLCDVDNGGCSFKCEIADSGLGYCTCKPGYRVSRNGACKDINECNTDTHGCAQNCRDLDGSYRCYCNEGYALGLGGKICNTCEREFNTTHDVIKSAGYPGPYQDEHNCNYTINIWPEYALKMTISVDIHRSANCTTEFLKLDHGFFKHNRRLCGYISQVSYYIKDQNVTSTSLRFRTRNLNSVREYKSTGFKVEFEQVLRSTLTDEELNTVHVGSSTIDYQDRPWLP